MAFWDYFALVKQDGKCNGPHMKTEIENNIKCMDADIENGTKTKEGFECYKRSCALAKDYGRTRKPKDLKPGDKFGRVRLLCDVCNLHPRMNYMINKRIEYRHRVIKGETDYKHFYPGIDNVYSQRDSFKAHVMSPQADDAEN